jgi:hypothetical protein
MAFHDGDLDSGTANRLLTGRLDPDDAPPGYGEVAQLLQDARSWNGLPDVMDDAVIVAIVDAITCSERRPKRKHALTRIVATKLVTATAVVALTATGAAAATGSLPDQAQNGLAHVAAHVGINLPEAASGKARDATRPGADESVNEDTPATATTAHDGATGAGGTSSSGEAAPATSQPSTAPAAPGDDPTPNHGSVVSSTAHDSDPSGGKGEEVSPVARDNHGAEVRSEHADPTPASDAGASHGNQGDSSGAGPANEHANPNASSHGKP